MYYIPTSNHPTVMDEVKDTKFLPKRVVSIKLRILFPSPSISHRSLSAETHILNILPGRGAWQPILEWRTNTAIYTPLLIKAHIFCGWNKCQTTRIWETFCCSLSTLWQDALEGPPGYRQQCLQQCLESLLLGHESRLWHFWEFCEAVVITATIKN